MMRIRNTIAGKGTHCQFCRKPIPRGAHVAAWAATESGENTIQMHAHPRCADLADLERYEQVYESRDEMPNDIRRCYERILREMPEHVPALP